MEQRRLTMAGRTTPEAALVCLVAVLFAMCGACFWDVDVLEHFAYIRAFFAGSGPFLHGLVFFDYWTSGFASDSYFLRPSGMVTPDQPLGMSLLLWPWALAGWTVNTIVEALANDGPTVLLADVSPGDVPLIRGASVLGVLSAVAAAIRLLGGLLRRTNFGGETGWVLAGTLLATPLLPYVIFQPTMGHAMSFVAVTAWLCLWMPSRWLNGDRPLADWRTSELLAFGVASGVLTLFRYEAVLIVATTICCGLLLDGRGLRKSLRPLALVAAGAFVTCLPQLIAWKWIYESWLGPLASGRAGFLADGAARHSLLAVLAGREGLFTWHPWTVLGFAGLAVGLRRDWRLWLPLSAGFGVTLMFYRSLPLPGFTYGYRYFCLLLPILALAAAELGAFLRQRSPLAPLLPVLTALATVSHLVSIGLAPATGWLRSDRPLNPVPWRHVPELASREWMNLLSHGWLMQWGIVWTLAVLGVFALGWWIAGHGRRLVPVAAGAALAMSLACSCWLLWHWTHSAMWWELDTGAWSVQQRSVIARSERWLPRRLSASIPWKGTQPYRRLIPRRQYDLNTEEAGLAGMISYRQELATVADWNCLQVAFSAQWLKPGQTVSLRIWDRKGREFVTPLATGESIGRVNSIRRVGLPEAFSPILIELLVPEGVRIDWGGLVARRPDFGGPRWGVRRFPVRPLPASASATSVPASSMPAAERPPVRETAPGQ